MKRYAFSVALLLLAGCAQRTVTIKMGTVTVCRQCKAVIKDETQTVTALESEKHKYAVNTVQSLCAKCAQQPAVQPTAPVFQSQPQGGVEPPIMNDPFATHSQQPALPAQPQQPSQIQQSLKQLGSIATQLIALRSNLETCATAITVSCTDGSTYNGANCDQWQQNAKQLQKQALSLYVAARNINVPFFDSQSLMSPEAATLASHIESDVLSLASTLKSASELLKNGYQYREFDRRLFYSYMDRADETMKTMAEEMKQATGR